MSDEKKRISIRPGEKVSLGDIAPGETKVVEVVRTGRDDTMPPTPLMCAECGQRMTGTSCSFGTITPLHRDCMDLVEARSYKRLKGSRRNRTWWRGWIKTLLGGGGAA